MTAYRKNLKDPVLGPVIFQWAWKRSGQPPPSRSAGTTRTGGTAGCVLPDFEFICAKSHIRMVAHTGLDILGRAVEPPRRSSRTNCHNGAANGRRSPRSAPVAFLRKIARVDRRLVVRSIRLGLDIAPRQWPHLPGLGTQARRLFEFPDLAFLELLGAMVSCVSGSPTPPAS
jgi:hypothetical protein